MSLSISKIDMWRKVGATLIFVESLFVAALALYMIILGITHDKEWAPYLGVIAIACLGAVGLFAVAQGVRKSRRWAYSPGILANLIAIGVSKYQFDAGLYFLAATLLSTSTLTVFCLVFQVKATLD